MTEQHLYSVCPAACYRRIRLKETFPWLMRPREEWEETEAGMGRICKSAHLQYVHCTCYAYLWYSLQYFTVCVFYRCNVLALFSSPERWRKPSNYALWLKCECLVSPQSCLCFFASVPILNSLPWPLQYSKMSIRRSSDSSGPYQHGLSSDTVKGCWCEDPS